MFVRALTLALLLSLAAPAIAEESLETGLQRLWDLHRLMIPPADGERSVISAGVAPADAGSRERVLAEMAGPGCVTRIWAGGPSGVLRVYVDGAAKPVIEETAADLLGGKVSWLPSPLAAEHAGGASSYLPIPFAKSVRITCDRGGFPFAVAVTTWPKGTQVTSLTREGLRAAHKSLAETAQKLGLSPYRPRGPQKETNLRRTLFLQGKVPGQETFLRGSGLQTEFIEVRGVPGKPSLLSDLSLREIACNDIEAALSRTMIVIHFDGVESVRAPIGAFFGCGPKGAEHRAVAAGLEKRPDGWLLYNRFPMPFRNRARIEIENRSGHDLSARLFWRVRSMATEPKVRFRALYSEHEAKGLVDVAPVARVRGNGRIVGVAASFRTTGDGVGLLGGSPTLTVGGNALGTDVPGWFGFAPTSVSRFSGPFEGRVDVDGDPMLATRWLVADAITFTGSVGLALRPVATSDSLVDLAATVFLYEDLDAVAEQPFPADATPRW